MEPKITAHPVLDPNAEIQEELKNEEDSESGRSGESDAAEGHISGEEEAADNGFSKMQTIKEKYAQKFA